MAEDNDDEAQQVVVRGPSYVVTAPPVMLKGASVFQAGADSSHVRSTRRSAAAASAVLQARQAFGVRSGDDCPPVSSTRSRSPTRR